MKYIRILLFSLLFIPFAARAATSDFMVAAQLLSAAKNADIQQVQLLVNNGANINFVDATGLSLVCTALLNNDVRAAQILQMYGADASQCDRQIKQYNNQNKPRTTGGLFSGLSSVQGLTLAAAGAAVVVGGLLLLTDVFDAGNDNQSASSPGDRPGGGSGGESGGGVTALFTLPYGPAMQNAAAETENYAINLNLYSPAKPAEGTTNILYDNFNLMTNTFEQNYLLMMYGYSPLARGYLGMRTLRNLTTYAPLDLSGNNLGTEPVMGGRPVNVAMVTSNGINATDTSSLGDTFLLWTTENNNGTSVNGASNDMISSKYYNNKIVRGADDASVSDDSTEEDTTLIANFDLSGYGTAINNLLATSDDNLLAKVVGGKTSGYANGDYVGFMPNGQMTVYRTGNGSVLQAVTNPTQNGSYTMSGTELATGDTITLFGKTLTITRTGDTFVATDGTDSYDGYIVGNNLYIASVAGGDVNQVNSMENNYLTLTHQVVAADYANYTALYNAAALYEAGDLSGGRSRPDIFANVSVISPLHSTDTAVIDDILSVGTDTEKRQVKFISLVNQYYDTVDTLGLNGTNALPGDTALSFFNWLGSPYSPLVLFSTGGFETDSNYSGKTLTATFESSAPLVFDNLEHLFMSVVAVGQIGDGTSGTTSVAGYTPENKYAVAQWSNKNGTPDDTTDDTYYKARVCGIGGRGANGIDPWCFATTGVNDELAVATAAGAAGAIKSAFYYLNNKQLFALLALTADGPYLGTDSAGNAFTEDGLISYLQTMYQMPNEYEYRWQFGGEDYLDVFKEVFGYGLINLERATTPGTSVYFYNGNEIVSASGNAYWRTASNTAFRTSTVFNPRAASISVPFFDILTSVDGDLQLPRVWENEFALGTDSARALYMGDVLGDLKTRDVEPVRTQIGDLSFSIASSQRAYADNFNGLDSLNFYYSVGNFDIATGYQHYFTDGASRFDGMSNPVFGLMTDAFTSDVVYNNGRWAFGGRVFSGAVTDDGLLENDPTVSSQYRPANLGFMHGGQMSVAWNGARFGFTTAIGNVNETDTILGAQTSGLLNLGAGRTTYIDSELRYEITDDVALKMRATFARTESDATGDFILGMSALDSDAFAVGADFGNFSLAVARPLGVRSGEMRYAYADYDIVESDDGIFDLIVRDTHIESVNLRPENRELRISAQYRHKFGEFTDGALGFIYRINPNHISDFGDEAIFMMKMTHRVGI